MVPKRGGACSAPASVVDSQLRQRGIGAWRGPPAPGSNQLHFSGDIDNADPDRLCDAIFENAGGGGAERVTYSVDDSNSHIRTIDCFDGASWTAGVESARVLTGLQRELELFECFDVSGTPLPPADGLLPEALRGGVRSVEISLVLQNTEQTVGAGNDVPGWFRLTQHVRLNNLGSFDDLP